MLGDANTQCHISPSSLHHKHGNGHSVVKMVNGETAKIYQKDNCTISDKVGDDVFLVDRRVVEVITTPIVSLTRLMTESWEIKIDNSGNQRFILIFRYSAKLSFVKKRNNLCCLRAKITEEESIKNCATQ